jgi:uncharacterized membrane protein
MNITYNHLAGRSVERLAALSDGIFGVGMTLLMLDLRVPAHELIHNEHGLWMALREITPNMIAYFMSFLTLGIFWHGQQTELSFLKHSDRHLSWINLLFLFAVTLLPFTTKLLSEYFNYRLALLCYWFNIFMLGALLYVGWRYALAAKLVKDTITEEFAQAVEHRILVAQSLYAFGAALCFFSPFMSVAFIVGVQIWYAVAPGYRPQHHIARCLDKHLQDGVGHHRETVAEKVLADAD